MIRRAALACAALLLASCVTGHKITTEEFDLVEVGMTEDEVVEIIGPPQKRADLGDNSEHLTWRCEEFTFQACGTFSTELTFGVFKGGRLEKSLESTKVSSADSIRLAAQCLGTTHEGRQCRRRTKSASGYCFQHETQAKPK